MHQYHMPVYQVGNAANLVGLQVHNNVLINHPSNVNEVPLCLRRASDWTAGKLGANNNLFIGYGARRVDADFGSVNKTTCAPSLPPSTVTGFANQGSNDYRINASSGLKSSGVDITRLGVADMAGNVYYSPPSVGPFEVPRSADYFGALRK